MNPVIDFIFKILSRDVSIVTDPDEARAWHKNDWDNVLIVSDGSGVREEFFPLDVLDSDKPVIITPAGLKIMRAKLAEIEEERDTMRADLDAIKRTRELLG
jgi:hypothetical protein